MIQTTESRTLFEYRQPEPLRSICVTFDIGYVPFIVILQSDLSLFMAYHRVCSKSNMMGATCGAGTGKAFRCTRVHSMFQWGSCCSLVFCVMFRRSLFVLFLLYIVLSVLVRFTASDYPFGIFKLFLNNYATDTIVF